jgi:hypothetical protein
VTLVPTIRDGPQELAVAPRAADIPREVRAGRPRLAGRRDARSRQGRQWTRKPIPPDFGRPSWHICAMAARSRRARRLFIRTLAPHVGFTSAPAITWIAKHLDRQDDSRSCRRQRLRTPRSAYLPAQPRHRASTLRCNLDGDRTAVAAKSSGFHPPIIFLSRPVCCPFHVELASIGVKPLFWR